MIPGMEGLPELIRGQEVKNPSFLENWDKNGPQDLACLSPQESALRGPCPCQAVHRALLSETAHEQASIF